MSILTLNPIAYNALSFTNIDITETDAGSVASFTTFPGIAGVGVTPFGTALTWGAVNAGVYGANSSEVVNFDYTVSSTSASTLIDTVGQLYTADVFSGPGVSLTAVENIYSTSGTLLGTDSYTMGATNLPTITLSTPEQTVNVQVTLTMSIGSTGTSASSVVISAFQQSFGTIAAPATASIGDIVFADLNNTGLESGFDAGPGVAGVTVDLLNSTGTSVLATTTTNANGLYSFTGLAAGIYEVKFVSPTGYGFSTEGVGGNAAVNSSANQTTGITAQITLTAGEADHNVEAGLVPGGSAGTGTASLGNTVWLDTNNNGLDDNGEQGVAGVTVDLLNATTDTIIATTTTNASGNYSFTSLPTNVTYEVQFVAPSGDSFTTPNVTPATPGEINSVANSSGLTGAITLTNGEVDNNVNAGLTVPPPPPTGAIGDIVWMDTNKDGLLNNGEAGVGGVTVELLNGTGSSILATTTTNSSGGYEFTGLNAGVYEVKFLSPTGDTFTTQGVDSNAAVNSSANQTTGVTSPITLTAGQVDNNVEAGLEKPSSGLSVLKQPSSMVVNSCGQVTYTFTVTNTGSTPLSNINIKDNIGTAANPDYVVPTLVTKGFNGTLAAGTSLTYTETVNQIACTPGNAGSVCHTASGSNLSSGCTAWLSSTFNPTSCANGATYKFQGVTCEISGGGVGRNPITVDCPDSIVTFSSACQSATTVYNSSTDCWVTTLPANCSPGSVFLTGVPLTIPNGCSLNNSSVTWSISDSSNNCGSSSLNWDTNCTGYSNFNQNGLSGTSNYNNIGVKSCDNNAGYGSGGSCNVGYGYNGSSYCDTGYNGYGGGFGSSYNSCGWQGSSSDCAGTPENQNTNNNCGGSSFGGGNNGYGSGYGSSNNGYGGGYDNNGCGGGGSSNNNGCGGGSSGGNGGNGGSCGDSGSATQTQGNILGAADTVTVTAATTANTTVTASDTKEVQVLGNNSDISVNGTTPTSSLTKLYGTADTLEFTYTPGNTVSLKQVQNGLATVSGTNSNTMAFIEISNNANPFASNANIYFEGSVTSGEKIYADATTNVLTNTPIAGGHFSTTAGADMFAYVFTSQAAFQAGSAPIQTMAYNTSGSQAMHLGDTIGSLSLVGFVGASGGHLVS
ncbi:SdrD B-like domain-containing protein [Acidisphaera sp. S103]|uniref:SdrD B-like domain-containing protein n=1 Tax=Acidisphaera sp. S103 TaxID=1747223 RepID=UPI00131EAF6C|nr:SdrD B-like domain-containing protein [Acidisphaera sp. S103]